MKRVVMHYNRKLHNVGTVAGWNYGRDTWTLTRGYENNTQEGENKSLEMHGRNSKCKHSKYVIWTLFRDLYHILTVTDCIIKKQNLLFLLLLLHCYYFFISGHLIIKFCVCVPEFQGGFRRVVCMSRSSPYYTSVLFRIKRHLETIFVSDDIIVNNFSLI